MVHFISYFLWLKWVLSFFIGVGNNAMHRELIHLIHNWGPLVRHPNWLSKLVFLWMGVNDIPSRLDILAIELLAHLLLSYLLYCLLVGANQRKEKSTCRWYIGWIIWNVFSASPVHRAIRSRLDYWTMGVPLVLNANKKY